MKSSAKGNLTKSLKDVAAEEILRLTRQSHKLRNPRRLRRAITSTGKSRMPEWTVQEYALLGKLPDAEVARRLGRTFGAVQLRRSRLGIPQYGQPAKHFKPWTPEELALLGTLPDRLVARKLRRTLISVTARRYELRIIPRLTCVGGCRNPFSLPASPSVVIKKLNPLPQSLSDGWPSGW